ncbi:MAG: hypothetical protein QOD35_1690, partial [Nocardioidaceae bacterium]|nr:hypothetical protein [Nocardioidaceae bacterium]
MRHTMLRPAVCVLALTIGMLGASGPAGADTPSTPASQAWVAPPVHTHITWKGYRGVRPGETMAHAATKLGGTVEAACGFRYVAYRGPVGMDNSIRTRSRRVERMDTSRRVIIGPRGVRVGMSARRVRHALGSRMRAFTTQEGDVLDLLVGPGGVTEWAAIDSQKTFMIGLAPTFTLAKRGALDFEC